MELTKERLTVVIAGAIAVVLVGVYAFLYRPAINKCRQAGRECRAVDAEVLQAREAISLLGQVVTKRALISERDISTAIDELTKEGRSNGVNFTSIRPSKIKDSGDPGYKILPIDMELESSYKELAVFLGSLEALEKSLVTVEDISVESDREISAKLDTRLTVNMYLSGR
ncbi:MAG: type 4a pilus biogenesis protein PilO [Candidatus Omnitrophica bacterium]|nr:type 4a pilus biogenesis protein PilO [Candidatus Omnitrophota bacterium]